jgi:hypothetical protein
MPDPIPNMTAAELRAALKTAEDAEQRAQREYAQIDDVAWAAYCADPANIEWHTRIEPPSPWRPEGTVLVSCRMSEAAYTAWCDMHRDAPHPWQRHPHATAWHGMGYRRTAEGILTDAHTGGSVVLDVPRLCSDEQWARIVASEIPETFRKGWVKGG